MNFIVSAVLTVVVMSPFALAQTSGTCDCCIKSAKAPVCLTEAETAALVEHIEMAPDLMGKLVNVQGIAVLELSFDKHGRVRCVKAISGHPIALSHLIESISQGKWRFKPYLRNGIAQTACGQLTVEFSFVENRPAVKVAIPKQ